jgi:hypothetical protein
MALFGFSDISFNKNVDARGSLATGPLGSLAGSEFTKNTYRFPLDIGNSDKGHYLMIYIRKQRLSRSQASKFEGGDKGFQGLQNNIQNKAKGILQSEIQNAAAKANKTLVHIGNSVGGELLNKVNNGVSGVTGGASGLFNNFSSALDSAIGGVVGGVNNLFGQTSVIFGGNSAQTQAVIKNSIKNVTGGSIFNGLTSYITTDSIALYMPDTLTYTYSQSYDSPNIGDELGGKVLGAGKSALDSYIQGISSGEGVLKSAAGATASGGKAAYREGVQTVGEAAGGVIGKNTARLATAAATGAVRNPMLEMLYKSPNFRTFNFEFKFYPRDEREALEVQRIVERLRYHQSPELVKESSAFLVPPSEFDIKFYYNGSQNPNIPPISTCVLQTIDIDYAPNGFSAYEVPNENQPSLGRTGMPVAMKVSLSFKETTYLTKSDFRWNEGNSQAKN